jgi:endonuclease/exonuclease/phosphatase (EEP) superfamily protein YafD
MATRREGLDGAGAWERNFESRLAQSRALAEQVARMPRPLVVAGDLNAPESSPVVRQLLAAGLSDSFAAAGRGHGFSYGHALRAGRSFLRIDHVLASADVSFARSIVGGAEASEHRPVIADLLLRRAR